jgi:hypothetical protein
LDPVSKLVLHYRVDDQSLSACRSFIADLTRRLTTIPLYTSDELGHYMVALWETYRTEPDLNWETLPFPQRAQAVHPDLDYAVFHKERKDCRVIRTHQRVVFGSFERICQRLVGSPSRKINTAFIERFNGTLRHYDGHLRRRSQCFAKSWEMFHARMAIVVAYYNFVKPHWTLSRDADRHYHPRTPAQAKGITQTPLTFKELLGTPAVTTFV